MTKEAYVFVVCGSKEHIDTLHFSLNYLKSYSQKSIIVLSDLSRNESPIYHDNIIDIKTPEHLNHHQASIYLKTAIHQFLPKNKLYCYLDTDVVAISNKCDEIFNQYIPPIRFAPDHCKVKSFSPYAVNCNCIKKCEADRNRFFKSIQQQTKPINSAYARKMQQQINEKYKNIQQSFFSKLLHAFKYFFSYAKFKLSNDLIFDKNKRVWTNAQGELIKHEINLKQLAKETNLKYRFWSNKWVNNMGEDIFDYKCNHLTKQIKNTFNIDVKDKNWQHWNGGVFLFNEKSHRFLDQWHLKTMEIFNNKSWKTRDQGTLIANVWEFGLENHPTLSKEWNFIADFYNKELALNKVEDTISDNSFKTAYKPKFIHVFHNWKNTDWKIWQWIESKSNIVTTSKKIY